MPNPSGYHTYGMNWQADRISFYVDGQLVGSQATPSDLHSPMYLLANLAVQSTAATGTRFSSSIDYIRVYSNNHNAVAVPQDRVSSPDGRDPGLYGATAGVRSSAGAAGTQAGATGSTGPASGATGSSGSTPSPAGTAQSSGSPNSAPCYCTGTTIRTDRGDVAVERLVVGDSVVTAAGLRRPIRWIGRRTYPGSSAPPSERPVRIRASALHEGVPARDLLVSPDHAVWLDGLFVAAGHLVNGTSITRGEVVTDLTYWHVELESHDLLIAEGTPAESFLPAPGIRRLFDGPGADDPSIVPQPYAQRTELGPQLAALRRRLIRRAGASFAHAPPGAVRAWLDRCALRADGARRRVFLLGGKAEPGIDIEQRGCVAATGDLHRKAAFRFLRSAHRPEGNAAARRLDAPGTHEGRRLHPDVLGVELIRPAGGHYRRGDEELLDLEILDGEVPAAEPVEHPIGKVDRVPVDERQADLRPADAGLGEPDLTLEQGREGDLGLDEPCVEDRAVPVADLQSIDAQARRGQEPDFDPSPALDGDPQRPRQDPVDEGPLGLPVDEGRNGECRDQDEDDRASQRGQQITHRSRSKPLRMPPRAARPRL